MHILLTDILRCPRCGPEFGLILLADRIDDRRVTEGTLGCANCRRSYPIRAGLADLRHPDTPPLAIGTAGVPSDGEADLRVAALVGAQPPSTRLLVLDSSVDLASRIAAIFPESQVVSGSPDWDAASWTDSSKAPEAGSVAAEGTLSRTAVGNRLPFATDAFAAAAVVGTPAATLLPELARVIRAGGRLAVEGAAPIPELPLRTAGFDILLNQDRTVVAAVRGPR